MKSDLGMVSAAVIAAILMLSGCGGGGNSASVPDNPTLGSLNTATAKSSALLPGDAECPTGGILVETGVDKNGNGILDASEVTNSQKVCNGAAGPAGTPGAAGTSIIWKGTMVTAPAAPQTNWAYYSSTDKKSYIWDGTAWQVLAQDGAVGPTGPAGASGTSIVWKGSLAAAPASPLNGWAYYDSVQGKSFVWDGTAWQILAQDGSAGATGPTGATGATGPAGPAGSDAAATTMTGKIYCFGNINATLKFTYEVAQFSSNFILATASISSNAIQASGSTFYFLTQLGYQTAPVIIIYDQLGTGNGGEWELTLDRSTLTGTIKYTDTDGTLTGQITSGMCNQAVP